MMPDKRMTEDEVVAELRDGMTIGIGGWGSRRKPMSLVRAHPALAADGPHRRQLRRPRRRPAVRRRQGAQGSSTASSRSTRSRSSRTSAPPARRARSRPSSSTRACSSPACTPPRCGCRSCRPAPGSAPTCLRRQPAARAPCARPTPTARSWSPCPALDARRRARPHEPRRRSAATRQFLGPDLYFDDLFCMAAAPALHVVRADRRHRRPAGGRARSTRCGSTA